MHPPIVNGPEGGCQLRPNGRRPARGTDGRIYPWGNDAPNKTLLNYNRNVGDTTEVGSYPNGASPYGALDMAGNVLEWVKDWFRSNYFITLGDNSTDLKGPLVAKVV